MLDIRSNFPEPRSFVNLHFSHSGLRVNRNLSTRLDGSSVSTFFRFLSLFVFSSKLRIMALWNLGWYISEETERNWCFSLFAHKEILPPRSHRFSFFLLLQTRSGKQSNMVSWRGSLKTLVPFVHHRFLRPMFACLFPPKRRREREKRRREMKGVGNYPVNRHLRRAFHGIKAVSIMLQHRVLYPLTHGVTERKEGQVTVRYKASLRLFDVWGEGGVRENVGSNVCCWFCVASRAVEVCKLFLSSFDLIVSLSLGGEFCALMRRNQRFCKGESPQM